MANDTLPCSVDRLGLVPYEAASAEQRRLVAACRNDGRARLLLLEHPHTYTLGPRGKEEHLLVDEARLAALGAGVHRVDRGGDITYHGPGQLVGYPVLDLRRLALGPRDYVRELESTLIDTLAVFGITGDRVHGRPGVWCGGAKIAAIGVRISRGVTSHGFALNVEPDLSYFDHIVPCGLSDITVTSMTNELGATSAMAPAMDTVIDAVIDAFGNVFHMDMRAGMMDYGPVLEAV